MPTQIEVNRQPITPDIHHILPTNGYRFVVLCNHITTTGLLWYVVSQHKMERTAIDCAKKFIRDTHRRWFLVIDTHTLEIITEIPAP